MSQINSTFVKGGIAMATAVALDMFFLKDPDFTTSLMIGAAAGAGSVGGSYLAKLTPALLPDDSSNPPLYKGQAVMERVFEVAGSAGAIITLERYGNINRQDSIVEIIGISAVAVAVAEVVEDFLTGQPISVFS